MTKRKTPLVPWDCDAPCACACIDSIWDDLKHARAKIERLQAALRAQEDAGVALNGRAGYEVYQALQDKADELRQQALAS